MVLKQSKEKLIQVDKTISITTHNDDMNSSAILTLLFSLVFVQLASAQDDLRIIIDVSGSMKQNDPHNLRQPALRMLNGLIPTGAKAGVWTFGRFVNMEVKWGRVNDAWRKRADQGAEKIHSSGQFTNIESALKRVTASWKSPDPGTNRSVILLTDGKVDISKDEQKNKLSREAVLSQVVEDLAKKGVRVYAIALSGDTDEQLLNTLAVKTGGAFTVAKTAGELQKHFLHMFERASQPDTVPMQGNSFVIDKSVQEMTLLVFRKNDKPTILFDPDGKRHNQKSHGNQVNWRFESGFDLITVKKPAAGTWQIEADIDPDNRVMVVTDLKLQVDPLPAYVLPSESINILTELHNQGKKISKNSFLKFVDFSLQHIYPGNEETLPLTLKKSREVKDKGIYLQTIQGPLKEGLHELLIQADARTFSRSKRVTVEAVWPIKIEATPGEPGEFALQIEPREEFIDPQSLALQVVLKKPAGEVETISMDKLDAVYKKALLLNQAAGTYQLQVSFRATAVDEQVMEIDMPALELQGVAAAPQIVTESPELQTEESKEAETAEAVENSSEEEDSESGWLMTVIILSVVNTILVVGAFAGYLLLRKKQSIEKVVLVTHDDDEAMDDAKKSSDVDLGSDEIEIDHD